MRRPAQSSTCPIAVVPNLARYLADIKGPRLWAYAADSEGSVSMWDADLTGGLALVLGAEGKGVRPLVRRTCDGTVAIPLAGKVGSLNVSVAAAVLLYEARRQRVQPSSPVGEPGPDARQTAMADPTLYLFDGYNLLHAGDFTERGELVDALASFVASRGVRGVVVFDGVGEEREIGPLSVRFAAHADDLLERLAAEHRASELVCVVSSDSPCGGPPGQEVRKQTSRAFLRRPRAREPYGHRAEGAGRRVGDRLDPETRERLERLRRGEQ